MRRPHVVPAEGQPFSAINTTPIIDVMLVLLIMMIFSLPPPTHEVPVDLPSAGAGSTAPPIHRLSIAADGARMWDDVPVDAPTLRIKLVEHRADPAGPVLHMQTDPEASYERFDETLAMVRTANITKIGFVGNPPQF